MTAEVTSPRGVLLTAIVSAGLALLVVVYAVDSSASVNGWRLPFQDRRVVVSLCPQGWDFFTRDPQETRTDVYRLEAGRWRRLDAGASAEPRHAFGFSRRARVLGMETGVVLKKLRRSPTWVECREDPRACLATDESPGVVLLNDSPGPDLCGSLAFVRQPPVPWAWSDSRVATVMHSTFFRADVQCSQTSNPS